MHVRYIVILLVAFVAVFIWASDKITPDGERTIYSVSCPEGSWQGLRCTGRLSAGDRYRVRALKAHAEVLFWTIGASGPSGRFSDCNISSGREWECKPNADAMRTITLRMSGGEPVPDLTGKVKTFHAVTKWRWYFLRLGVPVGSDADV